MVKKRQFSEDVLGLVKFYRENPIVGAEDLLGVDLDTVQKIIIHEMWFKSYTIITAGRGSGKTFLLSVVSALYALLYPGKKVLIMSPSFRQCVVGSTLVATDNGLELVSSFDNKPNAMLSSEGMKTCSGFYKNLSEPTIKLTTCRGFNVEGAENHKILVIDKKGCLVYDNLKGVSVNDYVVILKGSNVYGKSVGIEHLIPKFVSKGNLRSINLPKIMNEDLSYMIGLLVGDGCFSRQNYIIFYNKEKELLDKYISVCTKFLNKPSCVIKKDGVIQVSKCSKLGYTFFANIGLGGKKALHKTVPFEILKSNKKVQSSFLRGLFDSDGNAYLNIKVSHKYKISVASISKKLVDTVQLMLLNMGIVTTVSLNNSGRKNTLYTVEISEKNSILCFYENIGFVLGRKQKTLEKIVSYIKSTDISRVHTDVIPFVGSILTEVVKTIRQRGKKYEYLALWSHFNKDSSIKKDKNDIFTFRYIKKILEYCKNQGIESESTIYLNALVSSNFIFEKVYSIETGFDYTYDFTVAEKHDYFSNGFISHNSKHCFDELKRRYAESPILREACIKKPIIGSDRCYLDFYGVEGRAGSNVSAFPLGDGCVVYSSLLTANSGICFIGGLVNVDDFELDHQIYSNSKSVWSNGEFRFSDEKYYNGIRPVKKIVTKKGYSFAGTLDHKIKISREGEIVWEQLENINEGAWVLIDRSSRWFPDVDSSVTIEEAYELGFMENKELSFKLLGCSKEVVSFYISGIYDSRGYIQDNSFKNTNDVTISLFSANEKLVEQLQFVLLHFGIISTRLSWDGDEKENTIFELLITNKDVVLFDKEIGFKCSRKNKILRGAIKNITPPVIFDSIYYDYVVSTSFSEEPTYDLHVPDGHEYCVNGFFSHNSRIRGLRGHFILVDEFAHVPEDIFEMVIRPMGATTASPMENVRRLQSLQTRLQEGYLTQDEYDMEKAGMQTNKIIGVTSAYYQFNHVYRRIQKYQEEIDKGSDKYGLCSVSYEDMSEGFLDQNNVEEAKATMSRIEFNLEYRGIWESDSDGVFKASLLEKSKARACPIRLKGEVGKKYVIGLDPARSSDAFAVVIIEVGNPSFVVHAFQTTGEKFPKMAHIIYEFCEKFDTLIAMMDAGSGGGGVAIKDILSSEQFSKGHLILDMDDEEHKNLKGKKILRMHDPRPKAIAEANYAALNLLEQGLVRFPYPPVDGDEDKESVFDDIKEMLNQMMLITITETKSGLAHFDIPSSGKGNRKKDLYSAFILAAKGLYDKVIAREEETYYINRGGLVIPVERVHKAPVISNVMRLPGRR